MNNVSLDSERSGFLANQTGNAPTEFPTNALGQSSINPQPVVSNTNSLMTILFLLGCLGIAVLWAFIAARNYQSPRIENEEGTTTEDTNTSLEDLEKQVLQHFTEKGNQTVLTKEHFLEDVSETENTESSSSSSSDEHEMTEIDLEAQDDDDSGHILIQRKLQDDKTKEVAVPNLCTICLENYQPGDTVTWSTNDECPHVYHRACVATFFAHGKKKGRKSCLCPTCRQEFIALPASNQESAAEQTTDPQQRRVSPIFESNILRQQRISANLYSR